MSDRDKTRLYYAVCVCLLVVAAVLRFYGITDVFLDADELRSALWSRQDTIAQVVERTRNGNTSPILYPLFLYVIQKVESSPLSVRMVPAAASVLTIAALLFLLPRVGVSRWAAFIAALLSTGSVEAIRHAQHVREYSVDALVAVLMIVGLLSYLRGRAGTGGVHTFYFVHRRSLRRWCSTASFSSVQPYLGRSWSWKGERSGSAEPQCGMDCASAEDGYGRESCT